MLTFLITESCESLSHTQYILQNMNKHTYEGVCQQRNSKTRWELKHTQLNHNTLNLTPPQGGTRDDVITTTSARSSLET